jgi:uncharacterized protein YjbI with pentapeptide repeats
MWRRKHPAIRPLLFGAPLRGKRLRGFNFCNANLIEADLREAKLVGANFHEVNLGGAKLTPITAYAHSRATRQGNAS